MLFINTKTNHSFTFEPYEHNVIYGPNGSYKSMFLKYLAQVVTQHPFGVVPDPNVSSDIVKPKYQLITDVYTVAQCRSALNNKWPPRVTLAESEKAGFISNTSVCTSTEQLLYFKKDLTPQMHFKKDLTPQMRKLGHLTEKDRQIFADAYYYENHVQPTPKPSTVKLAHIKAKQSTQSVKARYYDKVEMDY